MVETIRTRRTGYGLVLVTVRDEHGREHEGCGLDEAEAIWRAGLRALRAREEARQ